MRLLAAGAELHFRREALAYHYDGTDIARALRIKHMEGVADVMMAGEHPELADALPPASARSLQRVIGLLPGRPALDGRRAEGRGVCRLTSMLDRLERARLHLVWRLAFYALCRLSYCQGVAAGQQTRRDG